jgi:hypothetical protein
MICLFFSKVFSVEAGVSMWLQRGGAELQLIAHENFNEQYINSETVMAWLAAILVIIMMI